MQVANEIIPLSANIVHAAASEMGLNDLRTQIIFFGHSLNPMKKYKYL